MYLTSDDHDLGDKRYDEKRTQDEMIDKCYYNDNNFIHARLSSKKSLLTQDTTTGFAYNTVDTRGDNVHSVNRSSYPMMLELITESLVGSTQLSESCYNDNYGTNNIDITEDSPNYRHLRPSDGYSSDESEEYEFDWDFDPS
mgnify:CR=1 FL=1